jgi:hypothetical protein
MIDHDASTSSTDRPKRSTVAHARLVAPTRSDELSSVSTTTPGVSGGGCLPAEE